MCASLGTPSESCWALSLNSTGWDQDNQTKSMVSGPVGILGNSFRSGNGVVGESPCKGSNVQINERPCKRWDVSLNL